MNCWSRAFCSLSITSSTIFQTFGSSVVSPFTSGSPASWKTSGIQWAWTTVRVSVVRMAMSTRFTSGLAPEAIS